MFNYFFNFFFFFFNILTGYCQLKHILKITRQFFVGFYFLLFSVFLGKCFLFKFVIAKQKYYLQFLLALVRTLPVNFQCKFLLLELQEFSGTLL